MAPPSLPVVGYPATGAFGAKGVCHGIVAYPLNTPLSITAVAAGAGGFTAGATLVAMIGAVVSLAAAGGSTIHSNLCCFASDETAADRSSCSVSRGRRCPAGRASKFYVSKLIYRCLISLVVKSSRGIFSFLKTGKFSDPAEIVMGSGRSGLRYHLSQDDSAIGSVN